MSRVSNNNNNHSVARSFVHCCKGDTPSQWRRLIFGPWGSETREPIHLKIGTFDDVHSSTPRAKYSGSRKWGVGWA